MTTPALNRPVDVLASYIRTRDQRIAKDHPWNKTPLLDYFIELLKRGQVRVGGRATCGTYTDPSWKVFRAWNEVVRKARQIGIEIAEENIKQPNAWATKAGGFWEEREYSTPINDSLREALELPRNPRQLPRGEVAA
jgi:hypothetical protein